MVDRVSIEDGVLSTWRPRIIWLLSDMGADCYKAVPGASLPAVACTAGYRVVERPCHSPPLAMWLSFRQSTPSHMVLNSYSAQQILDIPVLETSRKHNSQAREHSLCHEPLPDVDVGSGGMQEEP